MKYLNDEPMVFGNTGFGKKVKMVCPKKDCHSNSFSLRRPSSWSNSDKMEWHCNKCDSVIKEK